MNARLRRVLRVLAFVLMTPVLVILVAWTCGALYYTLPWPSLRVPSAVLFAAGSVAAVIFMRSKVAAFGVILLGFAAVLAWFVTLSPRADRNWMPEVARLPRVEIEGDRLLVRDLRNFDYRTPEDLDIRYEDRTYDLAKIKAADVFYSYWDGNTAIAHTMLSWDFGDASFLCLSVEVRREIGQDSGSLPGSFKQFEITYVLADERDLIRLRTNYRREEVYLIRTTLTPDEARRLLLDVLAAVDRLSHRPEFYRTIGHNCTTSLVDHINAVSPGRVPYTKKILMNGYAPEIAYANQMHATDLPFDEWKRRARINDAAMAADKDPLFSLRIREGLPSMGAANGVGR